MSKEYVSAGRSPEKYSVVSQYASSSNGRGNGDDYNDNHKRDQRKKKHSRSRSRDRGRDREKKKKRDRSRDRERDHGYNRKREKDRSSRDNDVDRDRRKRDKDRDRERDRDCDRDSRSRRSRSRTHEIYDSKRRRRRERSHSHGDHEEHEHSRRSPREKSDRYRKEQIKEEARETRFDLTQTIQELISTTSSSKNFAALFNCNNSNDSISNGPSENSQDDTERKRRKKSRWGGTENDKTFIPGMPTILPSSLDPTQQEAYLVQLQIEEISRKLRTGELGIPQNPEERSPSPEPIYSSDGKRLNTREFRYRKKLEEQRHQLIQKMQSVNPEFKPPADYKPPITRVIDKVLIPQEQHPDINFVGLLIGPRGNTLKAMEKETGAKIIIRGKGSVKEGKVGRKDGQPLAGEDEPLHAFITAPNPEAVKRAVDKIKDVIRQGIEVPEGHNDLRRMQLRELAQLNGTLRETDCPRCTNCGSTEHKSWLCPDKPNITNSIVCTACGGAGHISKDCRSKRPGAVGDESVENVQAKIDEEYMSLMAELGEGPPPPVQQKQSDPLAQVHINRGYSIFDKKTTAMQAIQAPPPPVPSGAPPLVSAVGGVMMSVAPPPPVPPGWNQTNGSAMAPMMPPPPSTQPPPTPAPQIMPWMNAVQPPPPGGDPPPPPGTSPLTPPGTVAPMPPLIPPPPGTTIPTVPLPPWPMPSGYPSWGTPQGVYAPPPPPPPCTPPPPGIGSLGQPPPPPPPSN